MQPAKSELSPAQPKFEPERTALKAVVSAIRTRVLGGLFLVLPIAITFWIILWLFQTLRDYVLEPVSKLVVRIAGRDPRLDQYREVFDTYVAPVLAIIIIFAALYLLGLFARSRLHRMINWLLLRVPVVNPVYKAVSQLFEAIGGQEGGKRFERVVLIAFPHPGMRVPAFVTATCVDHATGKNILCVYVPTTPVPTSGYMILVPEEEVTELNWNLEETIQAVVSGGITVPRDVCYFLSTNPK